MTRGTRKTRSASSLLALLLLTATFAILGACSGNSVLTTDVGIHRNSNGDWGHSFSVGINTHALRW